MEGLQSLQRLVEGEGKARLCPQSCPGQHPLPAAEERGEAQGQLVVLRGARRAPRVVLVTLMEVPKHLLRTQIPGPTQVQGVQTHFQGPTA